MAKKPFVGPLPKCCIEGCAKISRYISTNLCGAHDQRIRRYGDPHYVTPDDIWKEQCRSASLAYKNARPDVYRKRNNRHEHRVVAEQMLGRPLLRGEIVHHVDGNKHNNSPDNLQVMTQSEHLKLHHAEMVAARKAVGGYIRKAHNGN